MRSVPAWAEYRRDRPPEPAAAGVDDPQIVPPHLADRGRPGGASDAPGTAERRPGSQARLGGESGADGPESRHRRPDRADSYVNSGRSPACMPLSALHGTLG